MLVRPLALYALAAAIAGGASVARADATDPSWNHAADKKMKQASAFTVAPMLPIPLGTLQVAKLSNGATLVPSGPYYDLRDRAGTIVARFDPDGQRTLERLDRPIQYDVTATSLVFSEGRHTTLMTLPRPKH